MDEADFDRVIEQGRALQERFPQLGLMLRVKVFLLAERRATRDFVDVAALSDRLGEAKALVALSYQNHAYPSRGPQTAITRFAEACQMDPVDLSEVNLREYKGLRDPFTDWRYVAERNRQLGRQLIKLELEGVLPVELDHGFYES